MQRPFYVRLALSGVVGAMTFGCGLAGTGLAQVLQVGPAQQLDFEAPAAGKKWVQFTALPQPPAPHVQSAEDVTRPMPTPVATPQQEALRPRNSLQDEVGDTADRSSQGSREASMGQAAGSDSHIVVQNRRLSTTITVVTIAESEIGTGLVPVDERLLDRTSVQPLPSIQPGATFKMVHWQPSLICHYPLYFEDAMLERHGQCRYGCMQPMASGVKFLGTIPVLPYLYTLKPKHECQYALGHYRAGSCAPILHDTIPYDRHAMVVEAMSVAGFFWAMPVSL